MNVKSGFLEDSLKGINVDKFLIIFSFENINEVFFKAWFG